MKTQRIKKVGVLLIALFMMAGSNMYAQRDKANATQGRGFGPGQHGMMLPDLTEDQQSKIETLRIAHLKEMTSHRNQMNELRAKKQTLMTSDNADMKAINGVIDQMTATQNQMMKSSAKHQQAVRNLLTDEQKVYFDSRPHGRGHGRGMGNKEAHGRGNRHAGGQGKGLNPDCPLQESGN